MKMKKYPFQKVADHFKRSEEYRTRKGIIHDKEDPLMIEFIHSHASSGDRILEVGGAAVLFLTLFLKIQKLRKHIIWNLFMKPIKNR